MSTKTSLVDKARIAFASERVNQSLMFRVPWRRRRQIVRELRANLEASSLDQGGAEAVRQLGDVKTLINEYLDGERGKVDVAMGIFAAAATFLVVTCVGFFGATLFTDGAQAVDKNSTVSHSYGWMTVSSSPHSFGVTVTGWVSVALPLLMFLVFSRIWRLFTAKKED